LPQYIRDFVEVCPRYFLHPKNKRKKKKFSNLLGLTMSTSFATADRIRSQTKSLQWKSIEQVWHLTDNSHKFVSNRHSFSVVRKSDSFLPFVTYITVRSILQALLTQEEEEAIRWLLLLLQWPASSRAALPHL